MPVTKNSIEDQHFQFLEDVLGPAPEMNLKAAYVIVTSRAQRFYSLAFKITNIILIHVTPGQLKLHLKYILLALLFVGIIVSFVQLAFKNKNPGWFSTEVDSIL